LISIVKYSHELMQKVDRPNIAIDMTCGNGHDTLFLASVSKKVFAFDIQEQAINNTKKLLDEEQLTNVTLCKESHDLFDIFVNQPFDLAVYNLGYLPGGDKTIKTDAKTVLISLKKAVSRLASGGKIVIVIYLHNPLESDAIETFVAKLDHDYDVLKHQILNKLNSPYIIEINRI